MSSAKRVVRHRRTKNTRVKPKVKRTVAKAKQVRLKRAPIEPKRMLVYGVICYAANFLIKYVFIDTIFPTEASQTGLIYGLMIDLQILLLFAAFLLIVGSAIVALYNFSLEA